MYGVVTNSKDWIFTRYSMKAEMDKDKVQNAGVEKQQKVFMKEIKDSVFEYSQTFKIFNLSKEENKIRFDH